MLQSAMYSAWKSHAEPLIRSHIGCLVCRENISWAESAGFEGLESAQGFQSLHIIILGSQGQAFEQVPISLIKLELRSKTGFMLWPEGKSIQMKEGYLWWAFLKEKRLLHHILLVAFNNKYQVGDRSSYTKATSAHTLLMQIKAAFDCFLLTVWCTQSHHTSSGKTPRSEQYAI